jgi:translation initiation factor RLI1
MEHQVERVARHTGVDKMIEIMPQGYDTPLGRRFGRYDLSNGQWQQMAMARAFTLDASLLILDEPTSNLDAMAEYELFNRFRKLAEGRTAVTSNSGDKRRLFSRAQNRPWAYPRGSSRYGFTSSTLSVSISKGAEKCSCTIIHFPCVLR